MFCFRIFFFFFFQAEDGIRDAQESRGLGDVYKRQVSTQSTGGVSSTMRLQIEVDDITEDQVEVFKEAFQMFDKDGRLETLCSSLLTEAIRSGCIDTKEFRAVCESIGMEPTDAELKLMLMDVDKDNSGDVDLEEFIAAMKSKYLDTDGPEIIRNAFDVFDTDGSGSLSYEEMTDVLKNLGDSLEPPMIRRLIEASDLDKNGEVDLDEFMAMVQGRLF
eukprot:TRINITY_DN841_c0_g1_i2.p1 TRINITY_DN841_c0_g1~~TRINITY_DN841_c0_g1_i2.p1  ORF type:complete len:218 (+),score=56.67 TRINITY_DN841_c0_g1_i2:106-759(+)